MSKTKCQVDSRINYFILCWIIFMTYAFLIINAIDIPLNQLDIFEELKSWFREAFIK